MQGEYCKGYHAYLDDLTDDDLADCVYHCEYDTCDGCHAFVENREVPQ